MPEMIPIRWPEAWKDASRLELLRGTPFNCIAGEAPPSFALGDLKFIKLDAERPPEGVTLREGVWPRVIPPTKKEGGAGPTGGAWVDSNSWTVRLAQMREPGKTVWLTYLPPGGKEAAPLDAFGKPAAEAGVFGARWVVALDNFFADALAKGNQRAAGEWKRMLATMKFFDTRREWLTWEPVAPTAVISTFEGEFQMLAEEFLNLAPRRHLSYKAYRLDDALKASFRDIRSIVYLESEPPQGALAAKLLEFADNGGTLVAPLGTVKTPSEGRRALHTVRRYGKGRVAMPLEKWEDPYTLVDQVHVLMSHGGDDLRLWNADEMDTHYVANANGSKAVVHLISYTSGPTQQIVLGLRKQYRAARVCTPESETVVKPVKTRLGVEITVGRFRDYAAVELEA